MIYEKNVSQIINENLSKKMKQCYDLENRLQRVEYSLLFVDPQLLSHDVAVEVIILLGLGCHLPALRARRFVFDDYDLPRRIFSRTPRLFLVPARSINFPLTGWDFVIKCRRR